MGIVERNETNRGGSEIDVGFLGIRFVENGRPFRAETV